MDNLYNYQHRGCNLILVITDITSAHLYTHKNPYESIIAVAVLELLQAFRNGDRGELEYRAGLAGFNNSYLYKTKW